MESWRTLARSSSVIVLATILAACNIKSYRVIPPGNEESGIPQFSSIKDSTIYFNVPQLFDKNSSVGGNRKEPLVRAQLFASLLEKTLIDNPSFGKAVLTSAPSEKGFYTSITVRGVNHFDASSIVYLILSSCTLTLIPYYTDDVAQYVISYKLYQDGEPVKEYQHRVQQKTLVWLLVLLAVPFIHDSWFTPPWVVPKEIAFADTAKRFWLDAHRDGFF